MSNGMVAENGRDLVAERIRLVLIGLVALVTCAGLLFVPSQDHEKVLAMGGALGTALGFLAGRSTSTR